MPNFNMGPLSHGRNKTNVDGNANRNMMNRVAKDPRDLELMINDFELTGHKGAEEEDPEDDEFYIYNYKPRDTKNISRMVTAECDKGFNESPLPFKLKYYFDPNNDEEEEEILDRYVASQNDYGSNTRLNRIRKKTDYEAAVDKPHITTAGLGTGRVSARNRSGPGTKWPGGPGVKYSQSKLRDLIRSEVTKHLNELSRKKVIDDAEPEDVKDEASVAANVAGYSLPLGVSNWRGKWDKAYDPESAVNRKKKRR